MKWKAGAMPWLVVVGHNPEAADIDNPRGEIIEEHCFLLLENERGRRLMGPRISGPRSGLVAAIQRSLDKGWQPQGFQPIDPSYGSTAYQEEGTEAERAAYERKAEQEAQWLASSRR